MQVTKEALDPCQVALTIEVEPDKVGQAFDRAYREYGKYVSVPGFRKGKAPLSFVKQRIPEADVRQRTAEMLVEPAYASALEQEGIDPFALPKLELVQLDADGKPFIFKAVVPLRPEVELGTYTGLTVVKKKYTLTDENVDAQLDMMRQRAAEYPIAERPAQTGDLVVAELSALVDIRPEAAEARPTMIEIGSDNIPGFDEQLVGMNKGDEKTFALTYPENYPDAELAGQDVEFTVVVNELHEKKVPELDDALATKLSNGRYETLTALKADLRADMEKSLVQSSESESDSSLLDQIIEGSTVKFPPVLVETEVDDDVKQLLERLERQNVTIDEYLERIGKSREQIVSEFTEAAAKRIQIGLVLGKVSETETLTLSDADLDAALAERAVQERTTPAAVRAMLENSSGMDELRNRAQAKKVLDFLRGSAIIEEKEVSADSAMEDEEDEAGENTDTVEAAAEPEADAPKEKKPRKSKKATEETTEGAAE